MQYIYQEGMACLITRKGSLEEVGLQLALENIIRRG